MRDKYETKAYTQSNDSYPFSTPNGGRTTSIRLESHIHQPQRIQPLCPTRLFTLAIHPILLSSDWRVRIWLHMIIAVKTVTNTFQ